MALGASTKEEIRKQIQEGITQAFQDINIPPPDTKRIGDIEGIVKTHEEFINGNGDYGAKTVIQLLNQSTTQMSRDVLRIEQSQKDFEKSINSKTWAIILLIIGTLITNLISLSGGLP